LACLILNKCLQKEFEGKIQRIKPLQAETINTELKTGIKRPIIWGIFAA
jgi:hypothetical protein